MSCCSGGRRHFARESNLRAMPPDTPVPEKPPEMLLLHYIGSHSMSLRGPVSGLVYRARPGARPMGVDSRDASAMVRSGLFER